MTNEQMKARIEDTLLALAAYRAEAERALKKQELTSAYIEALKVAHKSEAHAQLAALIGSLI